MSSLSRRAFVGLLATAGCGSLVAACGAPAGPAAPTAAPPKPESKPAEVKPTGAAAAPAAPAPAATPTTAIVIGKPQAGGIGLIFYTGLTGPDGQIMRDLVGKFNQENGKDAVTIEIMPWVDMLAKMVATMAAGNNLDVVLFHPVRLIQFVEQDALLPLMDHLAPLGLKTDDYLAEPLKWCTINGKLYALPMDQHQWNIWIRTDFAEQAGLDLKNPPKDAKTFIEWSQKLTVKEGGKVTRAGFEPGYPNPWPLAWSAIHSNGGAYTNDDWTKSTVNSAESAEALDWMLGFMDDVSIKSTGNITEDFIKGTAAQMINGPWNIPGLERALPNGNYQVYTMPPLFKKQVVTASAHSWAMPAQKDKARIDATARYIKWMSDNSVLWAQSGQIPVKKPILESDEFKKLPFRKPFVDSIPMTLMWSNTRFYSEMDSPTGARRKNFEAIVSRQVSVKDGLARMEKEINEVLARPKQ
jgi:multiple sugar transport system substrate-binding protein